MQANSAMRNRSKRHDPRDVYGSRYRSRLKRANCRHTEEILERGRLPISRRTWIATLPDAPALLRSWIKCRWHRILQFVGYISVNVLLSAIPPSQMVTRFDPTILSP
eukprot:6187025-Pleurochrysis_carterae.AAC.1